MDKTGTVVIKPQFDDACVFSDGVAKVKIGGKCGFIDKTGEFVINLTTERLLKAADFCGVRSGRDTDKFKALKLTAGKASKVSCPIIEESPVNIECRVKQRIKLGSHDMFLAEVLCVDVSEEYLDKKGTFELYRTGLTAYSHGEYFRLGEKIGSFGWSVRKK